MLITIINHAPRYLVRWKMLHFASQECRLGRERELVFCRKQGAGGGGGKRVKRDLLLPLASVTSATCRKVKKLCF